MSKDKKSNDQEIPAYQGMPPYGPYGYPYYPPYPQPQMQQPQMQQMPPMMWPPYPPMWHPMHGQPPMPQFQQPMAQQPAPGFDWSGQAQGMVEGLMGEQAGLFKNIISTIGVDDKEFWKGAMIGAAAALILGNESVRNTLLQTFANAGDLLKGHVGKAQETTEQPAGNVKDSVMTGGAIFRDEMQIDEDDFRVEGRRKGEDDE